VSVDLICYRCGASLDALTLPLSRRDLCPACSTEVHVCKMCKNFDAQLPTQCREEDAEEVHNKENANFCDWFQPLAGAFDGARAVEQERAKTELDALFGGDGAEGANDDPGLQEAEDLFKT